MPFQGVTPDFYKFFWEITFQNDRAFFEENRTRYEEAVKKPMLALAAALADTALEVDENFYTRPAAVVSRIRRDTRFTQDKSLYRDHVFMTFKYKGQRTSECFVLYTEFERNAYGYGLGMHSPAPAFMAELRKRILTRPELFLSLVHSEAFASRFTLMGSDYARPKHPEAPEALQPYLNKRNMSFSFSSGELERTMQPALVNEIREGFRLLRPVYRFIMGLPF